MKTRTLAAAAAVLFVAGIGVGYSAQKLPPLTPLYQGKPEKEAARALLEVALKQAGKGSWERIGVARVYYLGGFKAEGQAIFDQILAGKHADSDVYRIARVYQEAGEWQKAKPLFDRYLAANPEEERDLAEVGAYYLLAGDRATAERMFDRAFAIDRENPYLTARVAGAYLGVKPQQ
jgi:tetratricopeptide (TPR) repeat protein